MRFSGVDTALNAAFVASFLFLIFAFTLSATQIQTFGLIAAGLLFAVFLIGLFVAAAKMPRKESLLSAALLIAFVFLALRFDYFSSIVLGIFFASAPFAWLRFAKGNNFSKSLPELGFTNKKLIWNVLIGVFLTIFLFYPVVIAEGLVVRFVFGITDMENVSSTILDAPIWVGLWAILIVPFAEETFFRAFLVPRIGPILSAFVFCIGHLGYGSIAELIGTFTIGLLLALLYKWRKSIWAVIAAHFVFNFISVGLMYLSKYLPSAVGMG